MTRNLLSKVPPERLLRVDMTYELKKQDFNSIIGRTAHIQILSDKHSTRMLMCLLMDLFVWLLHDIHCQREGCKLRWVSDRDSQDFPALLSLTCTVPRSC